MSVEAWVKFIRSTSARSLHILDMPEASSPRASLKSPTRMISCFFGNKGAKESG